MVAVILCAGLLGAQQKYALVIGNGTYTSVTKLNNPVNDANDMKAAGNALNLVVLDASRGLTVVGASRREVSSCTLPARGAPPRTAQGGTIFLR
jgi:hypothetical protein